MLPRKCPTFGHGSQPRVLLDGCCLRSEPHEVSRRAQLIHRRPITREESRSPQPAHRCGARVHSYDKARAHRCDAEAKHLHH